jgi:hypothetical protein
MQSLKGKNTWSTVIYMLDKKFKTFVSPDNRKIMLIYK